MKFTKQTLRAFEKMIIQFMNDNGWVQFKFTPDDLFYSLLGLAEVRPVMINEDDIDDQWQLQFIGRSEERSTIQHTIMAQELLSSIYDYNRLWNEMMEYAKLQY
jgi:hypothetical protein